MGEEISSVCVLDASTYVGFWIVKGLVNRGYSVHAAVQMKEGGDRGDMEVKIKELEAENLVVYEADVLDYRSILIAMRGCSALFCCLDNPDGYGERGVETEVRGVINAIEACAQTATMEKVIFVSSLAAAIWREDMSTDGDVDERSWSDQDLCRRMKLWFPLAKMVSEQAAWALALDRMLNMVSVNPGLVLGPMVGQQNSLPTLSYLKGATQMYESGVLAIVDVNFLVDVLIHAWKEPSANGRYFCFERVVNTEEETIKLVQRLSPLVPLMPRHEYHWTKPFKQRLSSMKLQKLISRRLLG